MCLGRQFCHRTPELHTDAVSTLYLVFPALPVTHANMSTASSQAWARLGAPGAQRAVCMDDINVVVMTSASNSCSQELEFDVLKKRYKRISSLLVI